MSQWDYDVMIWAVVGFRVVLAVITEISTWRTSLKAPPEKEPGEWYDYGDK